MYLSIVQQMIRTLRALDGILDKAIKHAEAKKFDPNNFVTMRLAPDMLPFPRQVQIACDAAKRGVALVAGKEAPAHPDTETTMAQLRERVATVIAYLETFKAEDFAHLTPTTTVKVPNPPGKAMLAHEALLSRTLPNFFFHVTTTYAMLRAGGVEIGKADYLGDLPLLDA